MIAEQQHLAQAFRPQGLFSRMFSKRRAGNPPRTIRHWTRSRGFVEMPIG